MRAKTKCAVVLAVALWIRLGTPGAAFPLNCANVCHSTTDCNTMCYASFIAFEDGVSETCYDYGVYDTSSCPSGGPNGGNYQAPDGPCGNHTCDANETCDSCPQDCYDSKCGACGDSICAADEYGGAGSGHEPQCGPSETWCSYCEEDCGPCDQGTCWPQVCGGPSDRYQCRACTGEDACDYEPGGWCATEEGQCNTYCYANADCPNSWDWYCDSGTCIWIG